MRGSLGPRVCLSTAQITFFVVRAGWGFVIEAWESFCAWHIVLSPSLGCRV